MRSCVARLDKVNTPANPISVYAIYSNFECDIQNCIAVDCDQTNFYTGISESAGCFSVPSTDLESRDINFVNCIGLKSTMGLLQVDENSGSHNVTFSSCTFMDITNIGANRMASIRGTNTHLFNCTFSSITTINGVDGTFFGTGQTDSWINNSIFNDVRDANIYFETPSTHTYNSYWNVVTTPTLGTGEIDSVNANTNSLKYITQIESGSDLSGQGEGGVDIGANIKFLIGTPGTLWGETGYNTLTSTEFGDFPSQSLIKTKMQSYTFTDATGTVSGDRGFASSTAKQLDGTSDVTLSSYIQEYLGNEYDPTPPTPPTPSSGEVGRRRNRTRLR